MTERPKQNEDEGHGIGLAGLNKIQDIQDIIARTAGSSSQSQPDPSLRARMFGLLTAALGGERQRAPRCPKPKGLHTKPKPEPKGAQVLSPSKRGPQLLQMSVVLRSAHVVISSSCRWESGLKI